MGVDEQQEQSAGRVGQTQWVLGLVVDPDFPEAVARRVAQQLPEALQEQATWRVQVQVDPLTAGREDGEDMLGELRGWYVDREWDAAVCLTDLPLRLQRRPVLAEADADHAS